MRCLQVVLVVRFTTPSTWNLLGSCLTTSSESCRLDEMSIWPVFIGHKPDKSLLSHGFSSCFTAWYPYAYANSSAVTFPEISDTPTMLKVKVLLSGVKTTLKRVAEKDELAWHGLSELDSIMRSPDANGKTARKARRVDINDDKRVDGAMTALAGARGPRAVAVGGSPRRGDGSRARRGQSIRYRQRLQSLGDGSRRERRLERERAAGVVAGDGQVENRAGAGGQVMLAWVKAHARSCLTRVAGRRFPRALREFNSVQSRE